MNKKLFSNSLASFVSAVRYVLFSPGGGGGTTDRVLPSRVILWGLVYGLVLSGVYANSWKFFGDIYFSEYNRLRIVPAVMVILVSSLCGFKQLRGLTVTVDRLAAKNGETSPAGGPALGLPGQLAIILAVLLKFAALLAMPYPTPWWPGDWRRHFNFLYPLMYYRVLILLGLWGKTGLVIAAATGPTGPQIDDTDRSFRRESTIKSLLGNLTFTFVLTTVYFSQWWNRAIGLLVAFVVFLAVYLISMIFSWRLKGHDRFSMFACAEVSEILLLFSYLAIARYLQ